MVTYPFAAIAGVQTIAAQLRLSAVARTLTPGAAPDIFRVCLSVQPSGDYYPAQSWLEGDFCLVVTPNRTYTMACDRLDR